MGRHFRISFLLFVVAYPTVAILPACAPRAWAPQAHLIVTPSPNFAADLVAANDTISAAGFTQIPAAKAQAQLNENLRCMRNVVILTAYRLNDAGNIIVLVVRYIRDGRLGITMLDTSRAGYAFSDADLGVFTALNAKLSSELGAERIVADHLPGDKIVACL